MRRIVAALICLSMTALAQAGDPHVTDEAGDTVPIADLTAVTYAANDTTLSVRLDVATLAPTPGALGCTDRSVQVPLGPRVDLCAESGAALRYNVAFHVRSGSGALVAPLHGGTIEAVATFDHAESLFGFYLQSRNRDGHLASQVVQIDGAKDGDSLLFEIPVEMLGITPGPREEPFLVVDPFAYSEAMACLQASCQTDPALQVENVTIDLMDRAPDEGFGLPYLLPYQPPVVEEPEPEIEVEPETPEPVQEPAPQAGSDDAQQPSQQEEYQETLPEEPLPAPEHPQSIPQTVDDKKSPGAPLVLLFIGLALLARYRK